jgi:hypothetical protein
MLLSGIWASDGDGAGAGAGVEWCCDWRLRAKARANVPGNALERERWLQLTFSDFDGLRYHNTSTSVPIVQGFPEEVS